MSRIAVGLGNAIDVVLIGIATVGCAAAAPDVKDPAAEAPSRISLVPTGPAASTTTPGVSNQQRSRGVV